MRDSDVKTIDRMVREGGDSRNFPHTKNYLTNVGGRVSAGLSIIVIGAILVSKVIDFFSPTKQQRRDGGRR